MERCNIVNTAVMLLLQLNMSTLELMDDNKWTFWAFSIRLSIASGCVLRNIQHTKFKPERLSKSRLDETRTATHSGILIRALAPCPTLCSHFSVLLPGRLFLFMPFFCFFVVQFFRRFFVQPPPPFLSAHPGSHPLPPPSNCISFLSSPPLLLSSPCLPSFTESSRCSQPYRLVFGFFPRDELFLNDHLHEQTGCRACSICFFFVRLFASGNRRSVG